MTTDPTDQSRRPDSVALYLDHHEGVHRCRWGDYYFPEGGPCIVQRAVAAAQRHGYRKAVNALLDRDRYLAWVGSDQAKVGRFVDYLESIAEEVLAE